MPNGNPPETEKYTYKLGWMKRLVGLCARAAGARGALVLAGDYNVIPTGADAHNPQAWTNDALYLPRTRAKFRALINLGLTDAVRATSDDAGLYTFWDYQAGAWQKNNGIRIDHVLLSPLAADRLTDVGMDKHVRAGRSRPIMCRCGSISTSRRSSQWLRNAQRVRQPFNALRRVC